MGLGLADLGLDLVGIGPGGSLDLVGLGLVSLDLVGLSFSFCPLFSSNARPARSFCYFRGCSGLALNGPCHLRHILQRQNLVDSIN